MINEKELSLIAQLTEIGMKLAEVTAENKILKDVNEKLMEILRMKNLDQKKEI